MTAEGFITQCPEAGVDHNRCLNGCGVCEIAKGHHEKFVILLEQKGIQFYPSIPSEDELRTTAILGLQQLVIFIHRNGTNGGGTCGEIIFKYPVRDWRLKSGEIRTLLLESS